MNFLRRSLKHGLTAIGSRLSDQTFRKLEGTINYLKVGRWMSDHHFEAPHRVSDRFAVFKAVADQVRDCHVLYLEFGVFQGESMRFWSRELTHPKTKLHGFDSFEGLPEEWEDKPKGFFSTQGKVPVINDPRVQFFPGWFDRVLPTYKLPDHDVLVITMDADLYSSSIYVLRHLRPWIKPGTYIYFDEMHSTENEPRAFHEFIQETGLKFSLVAADSSLAFVFFICDG